MPEHFPLLVLAVFVLLQAAAIVYDFWTLSIPNAVPYGLACLFLFAALADPTAISWLEHLAAGLLLLVPGIGLFLSGVIGGGDVKLASATALWFGLADLPAFLLSVGLFGIVVALALISARRVVPALAARLPGRAGHYVPQSLYPGEGVPYGVAVAGSAILLAIA